MESCRSDITMYTEKFLTKIWDLKWNCHVNGTTFQSGLRFQTGLSSLRVSCKRAHTEHLWTTASVTGCTDLPTLMDFAWFSHISHCNHALIQLLPNITQFQYFSLLSYQTLYISMSKKYKDYVIHCAKGPFFRHTGIPGLWMLDSGLWTLDAGCLSDYTNNHTRTSKSSIWIWTCLFPSQLLVLQIQVESSNYEMLL